MNAQPLLPFRKAVAAACIFAFSAFAPLHGAVAPEQNETDINELGAFRNPAPHPRLFLTKANEQSFKQRATSEPDLKQSVRVILTNADHMLAEPVVVHQLEGRRLLGKSREALARITHLSFAYRMTDDKKYLERAVREIKAVADMPDWNPSHFLDTAEMTLAMAVGYDWLYANLTAETQDLARKAIEEKGLAPYLKPGSRHGWEKGGNNWNQVCHAGMLAGALALMEQDPERAKAVVRRAVEGLPFGMKVYTPDGNYPEGPGYWTYGTTFNVLAICLLQTSLGTDLGLSQIPGFSKAGEFPLHTMGPTLKPFTFADTGTDTAFKPAMAWFAGQNNQPDLLWFENQLKARSFDAVFKSKGAHVIERTFPCLLVSSRAVGNVHAPAQKAWHARGENPLVIFRSSWTGSNAWFIGIKAGTPFSNHGHMDIGSFVMDAMGQRWSLDLGGENYNKLEQRKIDLWNKKQGSDRWKIFRYHNRSHSTLLVNDAEQVVNATAAVVEFKPDAPKPYAVIDMTKVYGNELAKAVRRFTFDPAGKIVIEDAVAANSKPAKVRWGMTTKANLQSGGTAHGSGILSLSGQRLRMTVAGLPDAKLQTWQADPPPNDFDTRNPEVRIVGFETNLSPGQETTIRVEFAAEK